MMADRRAPGDVALVRAALADALPAALPDWLETRRWFADKGRGIERVALEDMLLDAVESGWLALVVLLVELKDGDTARYFLPLAWAGKPPTTETIVAARIDAVDGAFFDATAAPWFPSWLLGIFSEDGASAEDPWGFTANAAMIERARGIPGQLMRAEQSNTSLRFGEALIVKLFRRLQPGPNPDEEVLRALANIGFARVPPFSGAASWRARDGTTYPIALAQAYVPNLGDGWSLILERLREVAAGDPRVPLDAAPEWVLGMRTGELHVALSQIATPAFSPRLASGDDIDADTRRTRDAVRNTIAVLQDFAPALPETVRAQVPAIVGGLREQVRVIAGFRAEAETHRLRVHGDFHLGQTLRTPEGDWVIIDFEGEPARPVAERREKTSVLKDVAGMLRSFAYARGATERALEPQLSLAGRERLARWESAAREAFLTGYRAAIGAAVIPLVPEDDGAFRGALAAWEFDKALYEISYEVRNRPDWIALPLRSLLPGLID